MQYLRFKIFPSNILALSLTKNHGLRVFASHRNIISEKTQQFLKTEFEIEHKQLFYCRQTHSDKTKILTSQSKYLNQNYDGLMTAKVKTALLIKHADCVPIFLYDQKQKVIALVHSGWKGTKLKIGLKTLKSMETNFGSQAKDILIAIGPCARQCCYFFNQNQEHAQLLKNPEWFEFIQQKDKFYFLDLVGFIKQMFFTAGVLKNHIEDCGICTICASSYHSYRKQKKEKQERINGISLMMIK
ncbi:peptidoglycan editing factor PgeF [Candidatus Beckwithbacteria bacterium]|nr:peptidoglycan editing factor PgeF [Candidatus Beckwithbacteria bacterium]